MSYFFDQRQATSAIVPQWSHGARTGMGENFRAAWDAGQAAQKSTSKGDLLRDAYQPLVDTLNAGRPAERQVGNPYSTPARLGTALGVGGTAGIAFPDLQAEIAGTPEDREAALWAEITADRERDPAAHPDVARDREAFLVDVHKRVQGIERHAQDVGDRAGLAGATAGFVGTMGAVATDPPVALSMLMGAGPGVSIARTMVIEGIVGTTTEAALQPGVQAWRAEAGLPHGIDQALIAVAAAGGGGALLGGLMRGAVPAVRAIGALPARKLAELFDRLVTSPTAEARAARELLEREAETAEANPFANTAPARAAHRDRLADALAALDENRPPVDPPGGPPVARAASRAVDGDNLDGLVHRFAPGELGVDARRLQFKAGADAEGVTDRLAGVKTWDPVKAGLVVVWEDAGGRRWIADGHQRLGLARRIAAEDPTQNVALYGTLLRESDGVTVERARVIAAAKNIAEGTGDVLDAAKVFREHAGMLADLPPRSALVRVGRDLAELAEDPFLLAVNGVVDPRFAAIVGRLLPGGSARRDEQLALMRVLIETAPENPTQAESVIRQAIEAGFTRETQEGLFGSEMFAESLFSERAKVLDRSMQLLRRDRRTFGILTAEANRIEAAGNVLAATVNRERKEADGQALEILSILAHRKGAVSDALNAAARAAREGRNIASVAREFVELVRERIEAGDLAGLSSSDAGHAGAAAAPARPGADAVAPPAELRELEQLDAFAEPGGRGQADQVAALEAELRDQIDVEFVATGTKIQLTDELVQHPVTGEGIVSALRRAEAMPKTHTIATPERIALRQQIADQLYGPGAERKERIADIVLGPPASGKSSYADPLALERGAMVIDSDMAKRRLPEFEGGIGAAAVHQESATIVERLITPRAIAAGDNIVWPMVGKTEGNVRAVIDELRAAGYRVNLHLVELAPNRAAERAVARFGSQGRLVDPRYVAEVGTLPSQTFERIINEKGLLDGFARFTNDVPKGADPRPIRVEGSAATGRFGGERGPGIRGGDEGIPRGRGEGPAAQDPARLDPDTVDAIPIGEQLGADGQARAVTVSRQALLDEAEADEAFSQALDICAAAARAA